MYSCYSTVILAYQGCVWFVERWKTKYDNFNCILFDLQNWFLRMKNWRQIN